MSSAARSLRPLVGNQCQYWALAKKPMSSTPVSMVGTDHRASRIMLEVTSKRPPRSVAARTPMRMDTR